MCVLGARGARGGAGGAVRGDFLQRPWAESAPGLPANSGAIMKTARHCPRRAGTQGQAPSLEWG